MGIKGFMLEFRKYASDDFCELLIKMIHLILKS